jgi:hypothetical protein
VGDNEKPCKHFHPQDDGRIDVKSTKDFAQELTNPPNTKEFEKS